MNTGISKITSKAALFGATALFLSGCVGGGSKLPFSSGKTETGGEQVGPVVAKSSSTTLARGTVNIKAPKNYCIDDASVTNGLNGSFARLAKCTALDGKGGAAETSAVMTVSVSPRRPAPATAPTTQDLAEAVAPAEIISQQQKGNLALVHVATGGDEAFAPADPRHWRGATQLDTRLVLLSLYAPAGTPMAGSQGASLLAALARGVSTKRGGLLGLASSSAQETEAEDAPLLDSDVAADATVDENEPPKGLTRVFGRLFNRS